MSLQPCLDIWLVMQFCEFARTLIKDFASRDAAATGFAGVRDAKQPYQKVRDLCGRRRFLVRAIALSGNSAGLHRGQRRKRNEQYN